MSLQHTICQAPILAPPLKDVYMYGESVVFICEDSLRFTDGHTAHNITCGYGMDWSSLDITCYGKMNKFK